MEKQEIRRKYVDARNAMPRELVDTLSNKITGYIHNSNEYTNCEQLFVFVNYGNEVVTQKLIQTALLENKTVAVPYMTKNAHEMVFLKIKNIQGLKKNKYGILEPEYNENDVLGSNKSTLIIVPGLVFDENKNRMGYGGGYYDKYLSENEYLSAMGVCFDFQIIDSVPTESTDVPLDKIVSDRRIIL